MQNYRLRNTLCLGKSLPLIRIHEPSSVKPLASLKFQQPTGHNPGPFVIGLTRTFVSQGSP